MGSKVKQNRVLELPEIVSGFMALGVVLWEACFVPTIAGGEMLTSFTRSVHLFLCGLVGFNTLCVVTCVVKAVLNHHMPDGLVCRQLGVGLAACFVFSGTLWKFLPEQMYWIGLVLVLLIGLFAVLNTITFVREHRAMLHHGNARHWSPSVIFFTAMVAFVLVSALVLLTPGASRTPISFIDALFTCASATSITGLMSIDLSESLTPLGKLVVLADFQIGAMGVMTFTYLVLLMVGKRLNTRESSAISVILDQEGVHVIPYLLRAVLFVTLSIELIGAVLLHHQWQGNSAIPQDQLWFYAFFHSVSAFCNAGITLFPDNMAQQGIVQGYGAQIIMLLLVLAGTLGFGVYLEGLTRLKRRLQGHKNTLRWSTHSWLVFRTTGIVLLAGFVGLALLSLLEPSSHAQQTGVSIWESMWNTVGRSAGFNLTNIADYGPVYQIYLCLLMFVGGNPAGTGGGVFAPVVALCVLEVIRVLRGQQDVQFHSRRIARSTVERAMATVVLSIFWIIVTTMILLLLEPSIGTGPNGIIRMLFLEVSAYTTSGYSLIPPAELGAASKIIIIVNMLFGRMGMFTFMLIFITPKPPQSFRYPETRLPLN